MSNEPDLDAIAERERREALRWLQNMHDDASGKSTTRKRTGTLLTLVGRVHDLTAERDSIERASNRAFQMWDRAAGERDKAEARVAQLETALDGLANVAAQYLDTQSGDIDGWIDRARATLVSAGQGDTP